MHKSVEKAINENRLKFYNNGSYSYKPSKEYIARFGKQEDSLIKVLKSSIKKLDNLDKAFSVAEKQGKRVSHISDGKIKLV